MSGRHRPVDPRYLLNRTSSIGDPICVYQSDPAYMIPLADAAKCAKRSIDQMLALRRLIGEKDEKYIIDMADDAINILKQSAMMLIDFKAQLGVNND
jgi:hypothetical protein